MKTKVFMAFIIAGAMMVTSCTKKVDEKTIASINQFGTDWTTLGEKASAWANDLTVATTQAKELAAKQKTLTENLATSKDEAIKTKAAEMSTTAQATASKLEAMGTEWNTFKASYDENTTAFTEWKNKVTKGEVTPEDATKGLADWTAKMNEAQTTIGTWSSALASAQQEYSNTMASTDEIEKSITTTTTGKKTK